MHHAIAVGNNDVMSLGIFYVFNIVLPMIMMACLVAEDIAADPNPDRIGTWRESINIAAGKLLIRVPVAVGSLINKYG